MADLSSTVIPSSIEDTDSPSSLIAEPSISDSADSLMANENTESDKKAEEERKIRRLERRKALALERCPLPPKLGGVLKSANNTIDLTNEDDDPTNKWFKKTFNAEIIKKKQKSPEDAKLFAVPRHVSKNAPRSLIAKQAMDKNLQASLSVKRRKAQEQRRKMYEEDNEHLRDDDEEEEEEEEVVFKKKKPKKTKESDSEDDEDYKPPGEDGEKEDDEMSVNLLNDSFTYDVFNNVKRSGPGSVVSNFDPRTQEDTIEEKNAALPTMSQIMGGGGPISNDSEDILNLCSGKFEEFPDTLQMLLNGEKTSEATPVSSEIVAVKPAHSESPSEDNEDEDDGPIRKKVLTKKRNRLLDSDEEDDSDVEETPLKSQDVFASSAETVEEVTTTTEVHLTRVVVSGNEDSEEGLEDDAEDPENESGEDEEEEEVEEEKEEEEVDDAPEPNFDDEDDELAVLKRIEHQEYKKQIKKRTMFDDEASLSGDDVGSDLEDEEGVENAYEAEEGDADDVPDDATIRRQNFKMLLKQENDQETRAIAQLQDRLLADGDLGGIETNRQFRFKLREEVEIQIGIDGSEEQQEDDEPEEDEQKKKERAEMIKYRIEHAEELSLLDHTHDDGDDMMFSRAVKLVNKAEKLVIEESEEVTYTSKLHQKPSLLSKSTLASSFQEVLNAGGSAPKQMYVQSFEKGTTQPSSSSLSGVSRLSTGVKRGPSSPDSKMNAKRTRSSKLSSLE